MNRGKGHKGKWLLWVEFKSGAFAVWFFGENSDFMHLDGQSSSDGVFRAQGVSG